VLGAKLITLQTGGHLSGDNGVYELPELLQSVQEMMK